MHLEFSGVLPLLLLVLACCAPLATPFSLSPPSIRIGIITTDVLKSGVQDEMIQDGATFWSAYVNNMSGPKIFTQVEVCTALSAGVYLYDAWSKLVYTDLVNVIVAPFSTARIEQVLNLSNGNGPFVLGTSAFGSLFNYSDYFSPAINYSIPTQSIELAATKAKTYTLFVDQTLLVNGLINTTIEYLTSQNLTLDLNHVIVSSLAVSQQDPMSSELNTTMNDLWAITGNVTSDLFIACLTSSAFPFVRVAMQEIGFPFKLAVFLNPLAPLAPSDIHNADGWLIEAVYFPGGPDSQSTQFNDAFVTLMGKPPSALAAIVVAGLSTLWAAFNDTTTNYTDPSVLQRKLFEIAPYNTFGALNSVNGTIQYIPVEYYNGKAHVVDEDTFVYPAPPYIARIRDNDSSGNNGAGVLAGIIVAVAVFVIMLFALALTVIRKQKNKVHQAIFEAEEGQRRTYKIDFESLEVLTLIGTGSFGYVHSGIYRGAEVAVKKLKQQIMTAQESDNFLREAAVMVGLRHPNIILFMGVCTTPPNMCIITELLPRGSLYSVLHNDNIKLPFRVCIRMALDVLRGLQFIHMTGFIHRDLKSPNLLVDKDWNIKIADFGLSCTTAYVEDDGHISLLWAAPEVLVGERNCYSEKSDIYGFGIVFWEILSRKTPYETLSTSTIMKRVVNGYRPPVDNDWHPAAVGVMTSSWESMPSKRTTVLAARKALEGLEEDNSAAELPNTVPDLAPPPPSSTVTLVFMDIYNSTTLWEAFPLVMASAMRIYNLLVHKFVNTEKGYEVANSGSAYVIAFPEVVDAVNFCIRMQVAMMKAQWPDTLIEHPDAKRERVFRRGKEEVVLRGLRVRMGVHTCSPTYYRNPLTGSIDYSGPGVEMAARLVDNAQGGQVLMTKDLHTVILEDAGKQHPRIDGFYAESMGQSGIGELFQIVPKDYYGRIGFFKSRAPYVTQTPYGSSQNLPPPTRLPPINAEAKRTRSLLGENPWILNFTELNLTTAIGSGSFGTVHQATYQNNPVAVKIFTKQNYSDSIMLQMRGESALSIKLDHPNIVKFVGLIVEPPTIGLVTEYVDNGNLADLLYNRKNEISWKRRVQIAKDIATGMIYLHSFKIVNCDLKTTNILLTKDWEAKIGDFGFNETKLENHSMTQCGNIAHTAPEIFQESFPTEQSDVYSFALILWQMIFRTRPWQGAHTMKIINSVEIGLRPSLTNTPPDTPILIINLMQECWQPDPHRRPTFSEIVVLLNSTTVP